MLSSTRPDAPSAIDPGFSLAAARGQAAASMVGSALPAVAGIAQAAQRLATQRQAVQLLNDAPAAVRDRILQNLGAQKRAVLSELLGQDRVGQTTLLELIFRGPGSAP